MDLDLELLNYWIDQARLPERPAPAFTESSVVRIRDKHRPEHVWFEGRVVGREWVCLLGMLEQGCLPGWHYKVELGTGTRRTIHESSLEAVEAVEVKHG